MSDFGSHSILPNLWDEILKSHWNFLETEDGMEKLEERKKLEGCMKEFLCIAPHDRKFFLPETGLVLKKSVREMDEFTAYKAMIGFDSISQYANNLFTKPWRKEYRVIKMYSGFYHHEVKSNLVDAEKLFKAMGYRLLSNQILVLDGPICPDQVTNVSRDAMFAYVECKIMKQVYSGLSTASLHCTWLDVYNYREKHVGGATQTMKGIASSMQEKRFRKDKLNNSENCYATIRHNNSPQGSVAGSIHGGGGSQIVPSCPNCTRSSYHHHSSAAQNVNGGGCSTHNSSNIGISHSYSGHHPSSYMYVAEAHQSHVVGSKLSNPMHAHGPNYSQMSHSRSLEHYNDQNGATMNGLPPLVHRHSFDQQQGCGVGHNVYDSPYDVVDSGSGNIGVTKNIAYGTTSGGGGLSCHFNAYSHPYNVSGNRYPLPFNISTHLNGGQYSCNGPSSLSSNALYSASAAAATQMIGSGCGHKIDSIGTLYADCNGFTIKQNQPIDAISYNYNHHTRGTKDFQSFRQRSFPPDNQLIDFEERPIESAIIGNHTIHSRSQNNSFDYIDHRAAVAAAAAGGNVGGTYDNRRILSSISNRLNLLQTPMSSSYSGLQSHCNRNRHHYHHHSIDQSSDDGNSGYATIVKPTARLRASDRNKLIDKYFRNSDEIIVHDYEKVLLPDYKKQQHQQSTPELHQQSNNHRTIITVNGSGGGGGGGGGSANGLNHQQINSSQSHNHHRQSSPTASLSISQRSDSCNGFDDFVNIDPIPTFADNSTANSKSNSSFKPNKNQDGVGSFEAWDFLFQNLEKHGYSMKNLNEQEDLLVQSLDLDSMNVVGMAAADKRRTIRNSEAKTKQLMNDETYQKSSIAKNHYKPNSSDVHDEKSAKNRSTNNGDKFSSSSSATTTTTTTIAKSQQSSNTQMENGTSHSAAVNSTSSKAIKSALKQSTAATTSGVADNNNDSDRERGGGKSQTAMKNSTSSVGSKSIGRSSNSTATANNKSSRLTLSAGASTQVIVSSPNEWSCRFCTFLNPDTKRICEMCCRSKDFNIEATNAPTCV